MTTIVHTELANTLDLDVAALNFLSAMYYQQAQNGGKPIAPTQNHIRNMTGVSIYAQRRVRKQLAASGLMSEKRIMEAQENDGYRTKIYYDINCQRIDRLLAEVEAKKATKDQQQELDSIKNTKAGDVKKSSIPAVKMHQDWVPESESLSSYLAAYDIDSRFAIYDVLPEFVEYWLSSGCEFRPVEWQAKFHAAVRHQWQGEMNRKRNQSKVMQASDLKANAIAALKAKEAKALMDRAANISTPRTTFEKLTDRSWADGGFLDMAGSTHDVNGNSTVFGNLMEDF